MSFDLALPAMDGTAADIVALNDLFGELQSRYDQDEAEHQQPNQAVTPASMGSAVVLQGVEVFGGNDLDATATLNDAAPVLLCSIEADRTDQTG